jgi:hypothetical protein
MANGTHPSHTTGESKMSTIPSDSGELQSEPATQVFDYTAILIPLYLQKAYWVASACAVLIRLLLVVSAAKSILLVTRIVLLVFIDHAIAQDYYWTYRSQLCYACLSIAMIAAGKLAESILHHFSTTITTITITHGYRQELGAYFCLAFFLASETDWWFRLHGHIKQPIQGGAAPWTVPRNDLLLLLTGMKTGCGLFPI